MLTVLEAVLFLRTAPDVAYEVPAALTMAWMPFYNLYGTWLLFRAQGELARSRDRTFLDRLTTVGLVALHALSATLFVAALLVPARWELPELQRVLLVVTRGGTFGLQLALLVCSSVVVGLTRPRVDPAVIPPKAPIPSPGGRIPGMVCPGCAGAVLQRGTSDLPEIICPSCGGEFVPPAGASRLLL